MDEQRKIILDFLKTQLLGVISTVDSANDKPESALVGFSETDTLELIFGTWNDTRKFANLKTNPHVAFVISSPPITIQYEGVATMAATPAETDEWRNIHLAKNPKAVKVSTHVKQHFFKVMPAWIRYTNVAATPPEIFESDVLS
jgi:uncharacterized pyridoxamine 5'-phosphate oxidase family protein